MLRLTRTNRTRVSNRTAALAAFLLVAATVASIGGAFDEAPGATNSLAGTVTSQENVAPADTVRSVKAKRSFKVSLYLFRHN